MEQCPSLLIQFTVKWNYSERGIRRWGGEDFEQNAIPFGSKLNGKMSLQSYSFKFKAIRNLFL